MGDMADMVLDGILCQECGELMIDPEKEDPPGYPQTCGGCAGEGE